MALSAEIVVCFFVFFSPLFWGGGYQGKKAKPEAGDPEHETEGYYVAQVGFRSCRGPATRCPVLT